MTHLLRAAAIAAAGLIAGFAIAQTTTDTPAPAPDARSEASTADSEPSTTGPGPTRVEAGVPAGFARTRAGAVAAASAYVRTGAAVMGMTDAEARAAVAQMAADGAAEAQADDLLAQLRRLRETLDGEPATYRQAVAATSVDAFDGTRARVAVWHVGVLAAGDRFPPQAGWSISTFELVWEHGDWKVWSETIEPGPAPMLDDSAPPATTDAYEDRLAGFDEPGSR